MDFESALDGDEAAVGTRPHATYLKIHGCVNRDRDNTLWCRAQQGDAVIATKLQRSRDWLNGNLMQRDLVLIGFWSDWNYLNAVLENCINPATPAAVTLVDPESDEVLAARAPGLWEWANQATFRRVRESGDRFLDDLRCLFSMSLLRRMIDRAATTFANRFGHGYVGPPAETLFGSLTPAELFALRRDVAGTPAGTMPRMKRPDETTDSVAHTHMLLAEGGATMEGPYFVAQAKRIRVVRGGGQALSLVKKRYSGEEVLPETIDIVVAAGAEDDGGVPADIVRDDAVPNIVRPGLPGEWMTLQQVREKLGF